MIQLLALILITLAVIFIAAMIPIWYQSYKHGICEIPNCVQVANAGSLLDYRVCKLHHTWLIHQQLKGRI